MKRLKCTLRRILEKICWRLTKRMDCKMSFSQNGEDILLKILLFDILKLSHVKYFDIGANDPRRFSNTYLFYTMFGDKTEGILVEPNLELCEKIRMVRKRDIVLQAGVGGGDTSAEESMVYYMMSDNTLNTFSKKEAEAYKALGYHLIKEVNVDIIPVNKIFEQFGRGNLLSIDVEGLDFAILESLNYDKYSPECICVENCEHHAVKQSGTDIDKLLTLKGYMVFADTNVNTIFVKKEAYEAALKCK